MLDFFKVSEYNVHSTLSPLIQTTQATITIENAPRPLLLPNFEFTHYKFDSQVQEFLKLNLDIAIKIPEINDEINRILNEKIDPQFELINDEETGEASELVFSFKIKGKTYEEILDLWDKVSEEVSKNLDIETSKKISVVLNGE